MTTMRTTLHSGVPAIALAVAVIVAACGGTGSVSDSGRIGHAGHGIDDRRGHARPHGGPAPHHGPSAELRPGDRSPGARPAPRRRSHGHRAGGAILDVVPDGFPVIPGAKPAEGLDEPASGWWLAEANVDDVASWYAGGARRAGLHRLGDLSSPLEDGSRVLDVSSDLPECRLQLAFRPAGGSTIIMVLYGAGCAGGEG